MNPSTTTPEAPAQLSPREQRLMELLKRVRAPGGATDVEAMVELTDLLPEEDDQPLETPWHFAAIWLLKEVLYYHWRHREDFYIGGNMFIYYELEHLPRTQFRGPDFFYVAGADRRKERDKWVVWIEGGKYPDFIIEFLSPSTANVDRTTKKELYEKVWRTAEYFCYDPDLGELTGWRLEAGKGYQPIPLDERGWAWSSQLGMWLGKWSGTFQDIDAVWLRPYDAEGQLILFAGEAERQLAEAERQRAEAERQRADRAEEELARLKARLAELERGHADEGPPS